MARADDAGAGAAGTDVAFNKGGPLFPFQRGYVPLGLVRARMYCAAGPSALLAPDQPVIKNLDARLGGLGRLISAIDRS